MVGMQVLGRRILDALRVNPDNPDLLLAQCAALSRLIPLLYFILVVNSWMIVATFYAVAPFALTVGVALLLTAICVVRLVVWWTTRGAALRPETALKELRRTPRLTALLGLGFCMWGISLFPYGGPAAQGHVVFYLSISLISTMFCLIHVRSAALILAGIAGTTIVGFMIAQGTLTFTAIAINIVLVTIAAVIVILIQNRDFVRMVEGQKRFELLSNENLRLANLDSLTDLPNRRAFFSYLREAVDSAVSSNRRLAVGILDLDGFKPVNDLYGHTTGDRLLAEVAARLSERAEKMDVFVARLGGDEFAFVVSDAPDDEVLLQAGDAVCETLRVPFRLTDAVVQVSGSIGIAVYPDMAQTAEQLFERADYALYHGKHSKRGCTILFSSSHQEQINADAHVEQALKLADFESELDVMFQPIVDVRKGRTVGFEALARWTSPILGPVSPARFIPVAERAGFVSSLTRPLLRKALAVAVSWGDDIRLSFNLSAQDLNSSENVILIVAIIEQSGFSPHRMDLEITETAFAHDFEQVQKSISILRRLGCGISLDDFGTGYSSLSRLHALPLTKIKIDRSFVTDLHQRPASFKIVKSLLALSRDMGLDCVVEGVETHEEMAALQQLGSVMVQGYFYSPPIPAGDLERFLNGGDRAEIA